MKDLDPQRVESFQIRSTENTSVPSQQEEMSFQFMQGRNAIDGLASVEALLQLHDQRRATRVGTYIEGQQDNALNATADDSVREIIGGSDLLRRSAQMKFDQLAQKDPNIAERIERRVEKVKTDLIAKVEPSSPGERTSRRKRGRSTK